MTVVRPAASGLRRAVLHRLAAACVAVAAAPVAAAAWTTTWTASPQPTWPSNFPLPTATPPSLSDQTVRQVLKVSVGGPRVRVTLSNVYGRKPLAVGAATVARSAHDRAITSGSLRALRFAGQPAVAIPAGRSVTSDPVELDVVPGARLAVSLFLPRESPITTFHWDGHDTAWIGAGNQTAATGFDATTEIGSRPFLAAVQVEGEARATVVAFGDSITDGAGATVNADTRWPDYLAARLAPRDVAVLNAGISGARLLSDGMGVNALARFDRDVLDQPRVRAVVVLIGINDIGWPGTAFDPTAKRPTFEMLVAGYRRLVDRAHAKRVRVVGGTLTPFASALPGTPLDNYYRDEKDDLRRRVNDWIRTSGTFDAVVDFDAALRDPASPLHLDRRFDSGDHLHPGDAGNRAMAEAVDLDALLGPAPAKQSNQTKGTP